MSEQHPAAQPPGGSFRLDASTPLPRYYQIKQHLKARIESGELLPEQALPSEHELCDFYGVSRPTVRQALQELIHEGLLERRRGIGTYVRQPKIRHRLGSVLGFSERVEREGRRPSTRLLEQSVLPAADLTPEVAAELQIAAVARVLRLIRLRLADDRPILLETVHLPLSRFPELESMDWQGQSLYRTLRERYGVLIYHLRETLEPVLLSQADARLLGGEGGQPAMRACISTADQHEQPVEYTFSLVPGDRCQYYIEFHAGAAERDRSAHLRQTQLEVSFPG